MADEAVLSWSKFWALCRLALGTLCLVFAIEIVLVFRDSEWHPHLVRLMARAWLEFVAKDAGSTPRGFVNGIAVSFLLLGCGALFVFAAHGFSAMRSHISETVAIAMVGLAVVILLIYGTQFAWEVAAVGYREHQSLTTANGEMGREIHKDKYFLSSNTPAYSDMVRLLRAFQVYRRDAIGRPCAVVITAPPDSLPLAQAVAEISITVSNCPTYGPDPQGNPDLDEETLTGMIPGKILIHAPRNDKFADQLQRTLQDVLPVERSYKPLPNKFENYQGQGKMGESVLWLQFGTNIKWIGETNE